MHCPGGHLLPAPKFLPELLPPHPEPFANTCHPLSVTKSAVPPGGCPRGATAVSLLPCQPLLQPCLLLRPEPCETTRLLPAPRAPSQSPRGDKKRVARSLPPCAPRCPEPARLRFPPCGLRGSSASCRGPGHPRGAARCPPSCPELPAGYSLPLRGVTECPPQPFLSHYLGAVGAHRCSRGYPTQEFGTCCSSEQLLSGAQVARVSQECPQLREVAKGTKECPPLRAVTKECPPLRAGSQECAPLRAVTKGTKECPQLRAVTRVTKECPPLREVTKGTKECPPLRAVTRECPQLRAVTRVTKECPPLRAVTQECPPLRAVTKGSALLEGTKGRSCSAQHLSRCRCPQHPRGAPRPSRLAAAKRSGHAKKNRCASKWLW